MGSHSVDKKTQQQSSAATQQVEQQQVSNATNANVNANAAFTSLFGKPGANGQLTGGTASQFLDPAKLNQTGLNGTYGSAYTTAANANANAAQRAVATSQQEAASRGMGSTPSGYLADESRKAYQDAATSNAQNYTSLSQQQLSDSLSNYWQANNLLNQYGTGQTNASIGGLSNANSANTSLYGTASQQVQNPITSVLSAGLGAAGAAGAAYIGRKP